MNEETITEGELNEKIRQIIEKLKINQKNMIKTIDAKLDELESVQIVLF